MKVVENLSTEDAKTASNEGLRWLLEMEALNNPSTQNALVLNIFRISKRVLDTQLVMDTRNKKMLVFLKLTKWGDWFERKSIAFQVANMIKEVLPSFQLRVTYSEDILSKSLEVAKKL